MDHASRCAPPARGGTAVRRGKCTRGSQALIIRFFMIVWSRLATPYGALLKKY